MYIITACMNILIKSSKQQILGTANSEILQQTKLHRENSQQQQITTLAKRRYNQKRTSAITALA